MISETDIILCIPGSWSDKNDFAKSFQTVVRPADFVFGGQIVMNVRTEDKYRLEFRERDEYLAEAFFLSSGESLNDETLRKIDSHKSIVYLIGSGGSPEECLKMIDLGEKIISAGGFGVKVETSGKAHSAEDWIRFKNNYGVESLCEAFIQLIGSDKTIHSCGMHNLGQPDVIIDRDNRKDEAEEIIEMFILGKLGEVTSDNLSDISKEFTKHLPRYSVKKEPCDEYSPDDLFFNPYGMLRLVK